MIPSTTNTSLLFVTRRPAWEANVKLRQSLKTDIFTARSGLEQRQGRQSRSRWSLQYSAVMSREDAEARAIRTAAEIAAPLCVPFWTERGATISTIVGNVVSIDRESDNDFFTPGDWLYFDDGTDSQFRKIASSAGAVLTLEAVGSPVAFASGTPCWPCRFCTRDAGSAVVKVSIEESQMEELHFTTL